MYLKVRKIGAKPGENDAIINISKMATIGDLETIIQEQMDVTVERQRLFYKGKQLVEDYRVMDYDIQLNDVVLLMIKPDEALKKSTEENSEKDSDSERDKSDGEVEDATPSSSTEIVEAQSDYYQIGDLIDVIDIEYGAWFEAKIVKIVKNFKKNTENVPSKEEDIIFKINMEIDDEEQDPIDVTFDDIRPRARHIYKKSQLSPGMTVLANYNIEEPSARGFWYDYQIETVSDGFIKGTILVGKEKMQLKDCKIKFVNEVMKIEYPSLLADRSEGNVDINIAPRKQAYRCNTCKDVSSRKCRDCGCKVCHGKEKPATIIMCDECDRGYHMACLDPPLTEIPSDPEWYCPACKTDENEIVKAGEKLKFSKKKAKMASNSEEANRRDWGRGMACVGRTKECTIVPKDHYGPVPGVEVGTCWKFRLQVSEAGIHRPHVAGIHGRETDGAYSLVLSGGYEDDVDYGEEFYYTGSGGRDLSGNKRISEQSSNQTLTRMNKALALNCNAKFNDLTGAEAKDWRGGKPVRVVRNYKLGKHSKYAPKDGNRYDGIYKVVKYYPEKGKAGFIVWRYLLRRDDPSPAPWDENGQELEMIYPPGYLEAQAEKDDKKGSKRVLTDSSNTPPMKKPKSDTYKLDENIEKLINNDTTNEKLWSECKENLNEGKQKFLNKVEELFMCICCQEVVYLPITTECKHNVCQSCLKRSFLSEIYTCPYCRFDLGKDYKMKVNQALSSALHNLFPGYEAGR